MSDLTYMDRAIHAEAALGKLVRAARLNDRDVMAHLGEVLAENASLKTLRDATAQTLARAIAKHENGESYEGYESTHYQFAEYLIRRLVEAGLEKEKRR